MINKNLNSYVDIMNYIDTLNEERKVINSKLSVMGSSLFNVHIKEEKNRYKKRLKEIKNIFKYFDNLIKEYTTFDSNILLPFLEEYLSKYTSTKYVLCNGEEAVYVGKVWMYYNYYFIYPVRDILRLKHKGYNIDDKISYNLLKNSTNQRYISLEDEKCYTLMNLSGLTKYFENFPELEEGIIRLIDLKISNPKISDEERLRNSLLSVMSNREIKIEKRFSNGKSKLSNMSLSKIYSIKKR